MLQVKHVSAVVSHVEQEVTHSSHSSLLSELMNFPFPQVHVEPSSVYPVLQLKHVVAESSHVEQDESHCFRQSAFTFPLLQIDAASLHEAAQRYKKTSKAADPRLASEKAKLPAYCVKGLLAPQPKVLNLFRSKRGVMLVLFK